MSQNSEKSLFFFFILSEKKSSIQIAFESKLNKSVSSQSPLFRCCPWWIWCVTAWAYACKSPPTYESGFSASPHRATPTETDNLPGGRRKQDV